MARFHATADGPVPFTAEEEAQRDAEEAEWAANAKNRYNENMKQARENAYKNESDAIQAAG